jgi:hypothetical protein
MVPYDPRVIQRFADRLYRQANSIIAVSTLIGAIVGGVGGYLAGQGSHNNSSAATFAGVGAIVAGLIGLYIGVQMAFFLKLRAQMALCQMAIEANTRGTEGNTRAARQSALV